MPLRKCLLVVFRPQHFWLDLLGFKAVAFDSFCFASIEFAPYVSSSSLRDNYFGLATRKLFTIYLVISIQIDVWHVYYLGRAVCLGYYSAMSVLLELPFHA